MYFIKSTNKRYEKHNLSFFLVTSCSKTDQNLNIEDTVTTKSQDFTNVESKDGRLIFKDEVAFKKTMQYLFEHQDDEFALDRAFANFKSYLKAYIELADKDFDRYEDYPNLVHFVDGFDGDETLEPVVRFELIKSVLNSEGILQIGDKILKYSDKFVYQTQNVKYLPLLESSSYSSVLDLVTTPILEKPLNVTSRAGFRGTCSSFFSWSDKRKTEGVAFALFVPMNVSEIFLKTRAKRKSFGRWYPRYQRNLAIIGSGHWSQLGDPFGNGSVAYSYNITGRKGYRLKKTIMWNWNIPFPFIFDDNNTYHDCFGDGGCHVIIN